MYAKRSEFKVQTPKERIYTALSLLGFSPKILGFSIESWVLGFFLRALGFSRVFNYLGFFLGFFTLIFTKKYIYLTGFWLKVKNW